MNRHLVDDEIATAVADLPLAETARSHLKSCLSCRAQIQEMKNLLNERRDLLTAESPDWEAQRQHILDRLPTSAPSISLQRRRWLQPVMAMAATLILAVGVGFLRQSPETPLRVEIADAQLEELLAEAERLMADDSIPGLWVADPVTDVDELENLFANGAS